MTQARLNARISADLHRELRVFAASNGKTMQAVIEAALRAFLSKQEGKE